MPHQSLDEEEIFLEAVRKADPESRIAYLDQACGENRLLRQRVERLLRAHDASDGPFDTPPPEVRANLLSGAENRTDTQQVGSYRLLREIGEGGMGVVYEAEQTEPVSRRVALKIIKPGMDSRRVVARFEAERQALAMMDHPNIAKVLDVGTTTAGHPYFVMELVEGVPITHYCNQHRLTTGQRVELLVAVCQAVQHAHQKGVIHRDIKPSNVLVAEYDGKPVPKVIDFGVAKAIGASLTDKTIATESGQLVGTLEYMSPEQARLDPMDVDTRTDIYSLGVLLYELLAGTTPLDRQRLRTGSLDEVLRIIREEDPPRLSMRLGSSADLRRVAELRRVEPQKLVSLVRGELDWIAMRSLEKDRRKRYGTATELAMDLERYRADQPVQAGPPTAAYRFWKFARRNRRSLLAGGVALAGMFAALITFAISNWKINQEKEQTHLALHRESEANAKLGRSLENELATQYFYRTSLAHRELLADNLAQAVTLLRQCPADHRQWEWYYLNRLCVEEPRVLRMDGQVYYSVTFSPEGRYVATGSGDGSISVFDVKGMTLSKTLQGHDGKVFSVAFQPKGRYLASAGTDCAVILWDVDSGEPVFRWKGHKGAFVGVAYSLAFSRDGSRLAAGGENGTVVIRNTATGETIHVLGGHNEFASAVAFSPDGLFLITGDRAGWIRVWDATTGKCLGKPRIDTGLPITAVAFHPDNRLFATASYDRQVKIWMVTQPTKLRALRGHWGLVTGLAFSRDGARLASSGEDKTVRLWDPFTGTEVLNLRGHTQQVPSVAFSPDGRILASASRDGTVRFWDATDVATSEGHTLLSLRHDNEVWSVDCSPDGRFVAAADWDRTVKLWDLRTGRLHRSLHHSGVLFQVAFSPDGQSLLSTSQSPDRRAIVRLCDVESGEDRQPGVATAQDLMNLFCVTYSPDGSRVLKGRGSQIVVCDVMSGREVHIWDAHTDDIWCLKFSPDGRLLASAANDGWVKVWDVAALESPQEARAVFPVHVFGFCNRVAFSADSQRLFTAGDDHTIQMWEITRADQTPLVLRGHTGDVYALAVSPDGRLLASAGEDTTIRIWNAATGDRLHTLRGHLGLVNSLAFVPPDGCRLVSGSRDHEVKVWDVNPWCDRGGSENLTGNVESSGDLAVGK